MDLRISTETGQIMSLDLAHLHPKSGLVSNNIFHNSIYKKILLNSGVPTQNFAQD